MKHRTSVFGLISLLVLGYVLVGCSSDAPTGPPSAEAGQVKELTPPGEKGAEGGGAKAAGTE
jgi:hypothetical protein